MTPRNFTPGGRTHTILSRLSRSDCMAGFLFRALNYPDPVPDGTRKKFWRLVDVLKADGLVYQREDKVFILLPPGEAELQRLNAMSEAPIAGEPTVRLFDYRGREAA